MNPLKAYLKQYDCKALTFSIYSNIDYNRVTRLCRMDSESFNNSLRLHEYELIKDFDSELGENIKDSILTQIERVRK